MSRPESVSGQLHRATLSCPASSVWGKTDKGDGPARDGTDLSYPFCVRADPFRAQTCAGFGSRRTPNGRALDRVGAAWQAATYLPPAHINAHERAAPPVIHMSNGRRPSLSGKRGRVVVHTAPRHPAASSKPDSAETLAEALELAGRPPRHRVLERQGQARP